MDWTQDSELTSCNQFESLGGQEDVWGEIRFWREFPDGPRKGATYGPKIRLKDGTLINQWELKEDDTPVVPEHHPMFSIFPVNQDPVLKMNTDAPYDHTKPASQSMCNNHWHRIIRYSEVLLWYMEAKARTGQTNELVFERPNDVRGRTGLGALNGLSTDELAEAACKGHDWEVTDYWTALVIRHTDQFRVNRLKDILEEGMANEYIEVGSGIKVRETVGCPNKVWNDGLMYPPYLNTDSQRNPNLAR